MIFLPLLLAAIAANPGTTQTSAEIIRQNTYPDWFRDGKLGIWAHWGPQSVPMRGDWYARNMYVFGHPQYLDHVARFGHPSKFGYKDIIPLWKAEKWDPERLMKLYKAAGAKYFVSMGVHHDNFDLWNSKYNPWNATKMGPKRDVVGTWQRVAKKEGLHFGVSEHLGASFLWFQTSRGSDPSGPYKSVPYDGNDPAYETLYHAKSLPGDSGWYTNDPRFQAEWFRRISDLVDNYRPDLLYSDGPMPFGHFGQDLVAHFYSESSAKNRGRQEVVYTCKEPSKGQFVQDFERGEAGHIQPYPWQTDTSIGDWFYNKDWKYRHADWVIKTLVDVVSKNGNLLLNVVQRPDGSLDPEAEQVLTDMAAWMRVNSESIYGTRPWVIFGEGPVRAGGGSFQEDFAYTAEDIRYASKGDSTLYATLMGQPTSRDYVFKMLPTIDTALISSVELLGSTAKVGWSWQADGLHVTLPAATFSSIASVLKIRGRNLRSFPVPQPVVTVVKPDVSGNFTLTADAAEVHGDGLHTETRDGLVNLGFWDSPSDFASWNLEVPAPGTYYVSLIVASEQTGSVLSLGVDGSEINLTVPTSGGWGAFQEISAGSITISKPGRVAFHAAPKDAAHWKAINLRQILLRKR